MPAVHLAGAGRIVFIICAPSFNLLEGKRGSPPGDTPSPAKHIPLSQNPPPILNSLVERALNNSLFAHTARSCDRTHVFHGIFRVAHPPARQRGRRPQASCAVAAQSSVTEAHPPRVALWAVIYRHAKEIYGLKICNSLEFLLLYQITDVMRRYVEEAACAARTCGGWRVRCLVGRTQRSVGVRILASLLIA